MLAISKKAKAKEKEKEKTRKAKAKEKEKRMKAELRRRREEERNERKRMKREEARATLLEIYRTEDTVAIGGDPPYDESCEDLSRKKNPKYDVFSPYESVFIYPHLPLLNRFDVLLTARLSPTKITEPIVGHTQFAIDTHNEGKVDDRVKLREVTKCNKQYLGRLWYYITFEGEDVFSNEVNMYHATVVVYVPSGQKELDVFRKAPKQPDEGGPNKLNEI